MSSEVNEKKRSRTHKGVFLGAWVTPQMKMDVRRVAEGEYYGNMSMAMMTLLDEALTAREQAQKEGGKS